MKETLIVSFYVLIALGTSLRAVETYMKVTDPERSFVLSLSPLQFYLGTAALTAMICVEIVLMLTMHKLTLSLKMLNGQISYKQMLWSERALVGLSIVYLMVFLAFIVYFAIITFDGSPQRSYYYCHTILFCSLTLMYTVVMIKLNR